jgi:NAD(P)-dependent dehydrogenase (short-subunit alcohol dehydrogenase family)
MARAHAPDCASDDRSPRSPLLMDVAGTVALVTGAAAGTGRAIALQLAAEGALAVVADVDPAGGADTVAAIEAAGGRARFVRADVRVPGDVERMVASAAQARGGPHVLVNNAGGGGHVEPHFPDASLADWGATLDLNLRGAMLATQLALEPMRRAGGGAVVNVASTAGLGLAPYVSPEYAAAKAGVIRFTSTLAGLRDRLGVRVNCVVPDWIATERARDELARMTPAERAAAPRPIPPEDVAGAVVAFVRDETLAGRVMCSAAASRRGCSTRSSIRVIRPCAPASPRTTTSTRSARSAPRATATPIPTSSSRSRSRRSSASSTTPSACAVRSARRCPAGAGGSSPRTTTGRSCARAAAG